MEDTRIADLEAQVAELGSLVRQLTAEQQPIAATEVVEKTSSRRGMLKLAGVATAGVVAAAVAGNAQPAAANNGSTMALGNAGDGTGGGFVGAVAQTTAQTRFDWLPISNGVGFLFQAGSANTNSSAIFRSALAGWSSSGNNPNGVYGLTNQDGGRGVVGAGSSNATSGVHGVGAQYGLSSGFTGKANLYLQPNNDFVFGASAKTDPSTRSDAHLVGELENVGGDLWCCVGSGTPGTWRKISGAGVAGAFHALTPGRVYDSRQTLPLPGALTPGSNRTISVADRRDANLSTGAVVQANFVPAGATAVAANVTVTQTTGSGYLTVNPGGNTTVGASTINWSGNNLDIANGVILTLDGSRQLTIVAGGGGTTHFIVDITGYYL